MPRLRPNERIKSGRDFRRVYEDRRRFRGRFMTVAARRNGLGRSRLGLSVGKKVGNAPCRNRWKRLVREAFRLSKEALPAGLDLVVIPARDIPPPTLADISADFTEQARRADRGLGRR